MGNYSRKSQPENLSPWSTGKSWSFNPREISVASPRTYHNDDEPQQSSGRARQPREKISGIQLLTIGLLIMSVGMLAAIVALLLS